MRLEAASQNEEPFFSSYPFLFGLGDGVATLSTFSRIQLQTPAP